MNEIWNLIASIGVDLHPDRIVAISENLRSLKKISDFDRIKSSFGPNIDRFMIENLKQALKKSDNIEPRELAAALQGASVTASLYERNGSIELVWSGPSTGMVPVRHTEQVLLEIIQSARKRLFLVSFVAYEVESIIRALNDAASRQVKIDVLLESSKEHGGQINFDSIKMMKESIPSVNIYVWNTNSKKNDQNHSSRTVHAKCAVADGSLAFITSANLTTAAMERNMELGIYIKGGELPDKLANHLEALVITGIIEPLL